MRPTGLRWRIKDKHQLNALVEWITDELEQGRSPIFQLMEENRTLDQNAMFHALYRDLAAELKDQSIVEVKRHCKLHYGVVIRKGADPEWAQMYDQCVKPMSYEMKLLLMDHLPVTSEFSKKQGSEYIDTILSEYQRQGVILPDPRLR